MLPWHSVPFFYRTSSGAEIDLVIEHTDGSVSAIEIKRSLTAKLERGFYNARDDIKPSRCFVVHAGDNRYPIAEGIEAIDVTSMCNELISRS